MHGMLLTGACGLAAFGNTRDMARIWKEGVAVR
jgi:hypothetical protein